MRRLNKLWKDKSPISLGSIYFTNNSHMETGLFSNGLNIVLDESDITSDPGLSCGTLNTAYGSDGVSDCRGA